MWHYQASIDKHLNYILSNEFSSSNLPDAGSFVDTVFISCLGARKISSLTEFDNICQSNVQRVIQLKNQVDEPSQPASEYMAGESMKPRFDADKVYYLYSDVVFQITIDDDKPRIKTELLFSDLAHVLMW